MDKKPKNPRGMKAKALSAVSKSRINKSKDESGYTWTNWTPVAEKKRIGGGTKRVSAAGFTKPDGSKGVEIMKGNVTKDGWHKGSSLKNKQYEVKTKKSGKQKLVKGKKV